MKAKKIKILSLAAAVVVITSCVVINKVNVKAVNLDNVKQDVVYTQEDSEDDVENLSSGSSRLSESEDAIIKEKSKEALKDYLGLKDENFEGLYYYSTLFDENTLEDIKNSSYDELNAEYDNGNGDLSEEEYQKYKDRIEESDKAFKERLKIIKHGYIQAIWIGMDTNCMYDVYFNENTKEVEVAEIIAPLYEGDEDLNISPEERNNIAEKFIKDNNLAGIEKAKLEFSHKYVLYYEDENDSNKKAAVSIDKTTGKVNGLFIGTFAEEIKDSLLEK